VPPRRNRAPSRLEGRAQPRAGRTLTLGAEAVEQNRIRSKSPLHLGAPQAVRDGEGALGLREVIKVHSRSPRFAASYHNALSRPEVRLDGEDSPGPAARIRARNGRSTSRKKERAAMRVPLGAWPHCWMKGSDQRARAKPASRSSALAVCWERRTPVGSTVASSFTARRTIESASFSDVVIAT
jgi:hypothetical protein